MQRPEFFPRSRDLARFLQRPDAGEKAMLITAALFFFWLYRATFSLTFMDEDFAWLVRRQELTALAYFRPRGGVYYRPLAADLPYFVFSSTRWGLKLWKAVTLALPTMAAISIARAPGGPASRNAFPAALAAFWLLAPFQAFPSLYLNAFDYALYPAAALFLFSSLSRRRFGWAVAVFGVALLAKEQALALALAPLIVAPGRIPRWYWIATLALIGSYLGVHGDLWWGRQTAAGFVFSWVPSVVASSAETKILQIFCGAGQGPWGIAWHILALAFLAYAYFAQPEPGRATLRRYVGFGVLLLSPLFFLPGVSAMHLGAETWGIFFLGLRETSITLSHGTRRFLTGLVLGAAAISGLFALNIVPQEVRHFREESALYDRLLQTVSPNLSGCTPVDRVMLEGLPASLGDPLTGQWAYWAIRWRFPSPRFYFLMPPGEPRIDLAPGIRFVWEEVWRTKGHPAIRFIHDSSGQLQVLGRGDPGCGLPDKP